MANCPLCVLPISSGAKIRCTCELTERERKLPHWAQKELDELRTKLLMERERRRTLQAAHAVLKDREWFTLPGPHRTDGVPVRYLYWDIQSPACSLAPGDVVLIGRWKEPSV